MLPLLAAFLLLALAIRRLLFRPALPSAPKDTGPEKSLAHNKLLEEAFEHAPFTLDHDDNPIVDTVLLDDPPPRVLVLYATEYGFSLTVAKAVAEALAGDPAMYPRIVNMLHYNVVDFSKETHVVVVCSTTGDGVPPNEAAAFHTALQNGQIHFNPTTRFAVLALGDRSYPHFCRAGSLFDDIFAKAFDRDADLTESSDDDEIESTMKNKSKKKCDNRLLERVDVDQEDWDVINEFIVSLSTAITADVETRRSSDDSSDDNDNEHETETDSDNNVIDYLPGTIQKYAKTLSLGSCQYSRHNPFPASVCAKRLLTAPATRPAHKQVARIELDISGSGLTYSAGDAVGVMPSNNPEHVSRVLRAMAANGDELIQLPDDIKLPDNDSRNMPLESALTHVLDLRAIKPFLISTLARHCSSATEVQLAVDVLGADPREPKYAAGSAKTSHLSDVGKDFVKDKEVIDCLHSFPSASLSPQQLIDCMRPLHARYYSISSTPATKPDCIAITVDVIRYRARDLDRQGVASTFMYDRCVVVPTSITDTDTESKQQQQIITSTKVPIFITPNPNFKLPDNTSVPIIMIGPGTGIAPFIGFIEQRIASKASGENILFFGCRHEHQDFLYKSQLTQWASDAAITLYTAFSRDADAKMYVQHVMQRVRQRLWDAVNAQHAHVYVCGDGGKMAEDVDQEWRVICKECGGLDDRGSDEYMKKLTKEKRYQRDVWVS